MKLKRIIALLICFAMLPANAFASVLGTDVISWQTQLAQDTYLHKNVFMSEQSGVGKQTEYYCEYNPNENVRPIVVNGEQIFGKRTVLQAAEYMEKNGLRPMLGINADFFSTKTGVPMGHTIIDGEIVTKDATGQDAIGFRKDGTAFISWLEMSTIISTETESFYIDNINKYRQPGSDAVFLLTDYFGNDTNASTWGIDVVLSDIDGKLKLGESMTATIESIAYNEGAIPIPDGKMVLTMDCNGWEEAYLKMQNLKVGEKVTITNNLVYNDERWLEADSAIGSVGGRLLGGGTINKELNASAAPRTAVGIKEDGTVIFYVLDGRQKNYSYGAKLTTIANRLAELGCVEAINLDGGGSTSIAGVYPGSDTMSVINSPSDGSLRRVANFIFLQNEQEPTGVDGTLYLYPKEKYYMNGVKEKLGVKAVDTAFYPIEVPSDIQYKVTHTESEVTDEGEVTFKGDGEVIIEAVSEGGAYGYASVFTYKTPTDIVVRREDTGDDIGTMTVSMGEEIDLTAIAYAGYNEMKSRDDVFEWNVTEEIGTIDKDGYFKASSIPGAVGKITVTAGEKTVEINVKIEDIDSIGKYPKIYVETTPDNDALHIFASSVGKGIDMNNVTVRVDGEYADESSIIRTQNDYMNAALTYNFPENFMLSRHKIRIDAYNNDGMLTIYTEEIGNGLFDDGFVDTDNHWAKDVISYMSDKKIVSGIKEHEKMYFKPNDNITRAQLAVIMCNYMKLEYEQYADTKTQFADDELIPDWARGQINAVYGNGIMTGRDKDGEIVFDCNESVSRAELATALGRMLPDGLYEDNLSGISDKEDIPSWSLSGFERLVGSGFIHGYEDYTIRPLNNVTRAETLQILYNMI